MGKNTFDIIFLNARPGAGKSEVIDFFKKTPVEERKKLFHIGEFEEIDDFPMLWTWFEEDHILEKVLGKPRLHSTGDAYFKHPYLWHLLIERICLEYSKKLRDKENYHDTYTNIIEFSRGSEHGGYKEAYAHINEDMLKKAVILYVNVSFSESLRKNRKRFNPNKPDSILEHGLPDSKVEKLYKEIDWEEFKGKHPEYIEIKGIKVPYIIFENEDDVTTNKPDLLAQRLKEVMPKLWELKCKYH